MKALQMYTLLILWLPSCVTMDTIQLVLNQLFVRLLETGMDKFQPVTKVHKMKNVALIPTPLHP